MRKITERNNFRLKKLKFMKSEGLEVTYISMEFDKDSVQETEYTVKDVRCCSADLTEALSPLTKVIMKMSMHTFAYDILMGDSINLTKEQGKTVTDLHDSIRKAVDITGFSISGKREGFQVSAVLCNGFAKFPVNTPALPVQSGINWGFNFDELITKVEDEVYEYLFNGKTDELSIFG